MKVLTPDQIKRVSKKYDVDFILKNKSELMRIASRVVPIFSKIKKDEFMEMFVTTVFDNIYYTEESDLTFDLVTHEITHVYQYRNASFIKYVTLAGRGRLEGLAKCAEIELYIATGEPYDIDEMSDVLFMYGLGTDEVSVVKSMLRSTEKSFQETGNFASEVAKFFAELHQKS